MTTNTALTDEQRRETLTKLGLNPDAPGLTELTPDAPAKKAKSKNKTVVQMVEGLDPRRIPASEIVFDPEMLADFADLSGPNMAAASRHLFEHYKSPGKDRERNGLLHRRIGEFIQQVRRDRQQLKPSTGVVKEKVKQTKAQRDLAAMIAAAGLTADDLARLIEERK